MTNDYSKGSSSVTHSAETSRPRTHAHRCPSRRRPVRGRRAFACLMVTLGSLTQIILSMPASAHPKQGDTPYGQDPLTNAQETWGPGMQISASEEDARQVYSLSASLGVIGTFATADNAVTVRLPADFKFDKETPQSVSAIMLTYAPSRFTKSSYTDLQHQVGLLANSSKAGIGDHYDAQSDTLLVSGPANTLTDDFMRQVKMLDGVTLVEGSGPAGFFLERTTETLSEVV